MNAADYVITTIIHCRLALMRQLLGAVISAIKVQIYVVSQFTLAYHEINLLSTAICKQQWAISAWSEFLL